MKLRTPFSHNWNKLYNIKAITLKNASRVTVRHKSKSHGKLIPIRWIFCQKIPVGITYISIISKKQNKSPRNQTYFESPAYATALVNPTLKQWIIYKILTNKFPAFTVCGNEDEMVEKEEGNEKSKVRNYLSPSTTLNKHMHLKPGRGGREETPHTPKGSGQRLRVYSLLHTNFQIQ